MKNAYRYRALLLAVLSLLIAGVLWLGQESLSGGSYLLVLMVSIPVLTAMSLMSVFPAFNDEDPNRKFIRTTKVLSLISIAVFGAACVMALYWMTTSLLWH